MTTDARYVAYYRVSTCRQGQSGLGLDAQERAVRDFVKGAPILKTFQEVESGRRLDRPQLAAAIRECQLTGATLVIAKIDRLARDERVLMSLKAAGVKFVAADMPEANELLVDLMIAFAKAEAKACSRRTKEALAAAAKRGVKLGNAANLTDAGRRAGSPAGVEAVKAKKADFARKIAPEVRQLQADGITTLSEIARRMMAGNRQTPRGGRTWTHATVKNLLAAMDELGL